MSKETEREEIKDMIEEQINKSILGERHITDVNPNY